jgi:RsiW-degrading membrane proteinase PrsW (M82 family)
MRDTGASSFGSTTSKILHGRIPPLIGTTALALCLFIAMQSNAGKSNVLAAYTLFLFFFAAYVSSAIKTNLLIYPFPPLVVYALFTTPAATPFFYVFRTLLPGSPSPNPSLFSLASSAFIGSGLMEELMKSIPTLIGLGLARHIGHEKLSALRSMPMQGLLIGFAAGAGFVYVDTLYHVLPGNGVYVANVDNSAFSNSGLEGYLHLLQRALSGVFSHVLWTSVSGFFIGLAARDSRSPATFLAIAWLLPAFFHTLWNLAPFLGNWVRWIKVVFPLLTFIACIVRARQIATSRDPDHASAHGSL